MSQRTIEVTVEEANLDEIEDRRGMEIATAILGTLLLGVVALAALVVL